MYAVKSRCFNIFSLTQFFASGTISRLKTVNEESANVWRDSFHSELLWHRLAPSHWFTLLSLEAVYGKPATHWQNVSTQHQQEVHKSPIKAPRMERNFEALRKRCLTTSHQTNTHGCEGWGKKKIRKKKEKKNTSVDFDMESRQLVSLQHMLEKEKNSLFSTSAGWPADDILN